MTSVPPSSRRPRRALSRTEKIIIIGGGDGGGAGAHKVTKDVAEIIAQLPPVVESLTGIKLGKLLERIPSLKGKDLKEEASKD